MSDMTNGSSQLGDENSSNDTTGENVVADNGGRSTIVAPRPSLTSKERRIGERLIETGIYTVSTFSIIFIFLILAFVLREAFPIVAHTFSGAEETVESTMSEEEIKSAREIIGATYPILDHSSNVRLSYIFGDNWQPNSDYPRYGIYPIIVGTVKTTIIALIIAVPISILAALYTAFFAPVRLRETIKPTIELLAGFPSVVVGFFCLMTVATVMQDVFGLEFRLNAVVGGIGLALAVIPIVYTLTEDALRAVPKALMEASLALGASKWQAAYQVVLPAATPGIFAAILLGLGRAFGETMIALMATGNAGTMNWDFFEPVRTFAATIGAEMGEVVFGSPHYQMLFLLGVILFIFTFVLNFITEFYIKERLIKRFRGDE